jgi:hypothetical protein
VSTLATACGRPDQCPARRWQRHSKQDRTIDRIRGAPYLTGLRFSRQLHLLDVSTDSAGAWPTRAGGNYAMSTAAHAITQRWARAIVGAFSDLDGIRHDSRFAGTACMALFGPAASALSDRPVSSQPLSHPGLAKRIAGVADRVGHAMV